MSPKTGQLRLSEIFSASDWVIAGWPVFDHKTGPIFWEPHNRKRSRGLQTRATEKLAGFVSKRDANAGRDGADSKMTHISLPLTRTTHSLCAFPHQGESRR
jgi:hypothetical protein